MLQEREGSWVSLQRAPIPRHAPADASAEPAPNAHCRENITNLMPDRPFFRRRLLLSRQGCG
jgi:hypothetical protein